MTEENQQEPLSKEEIIARRAEITAYYKESIEHLKVQKEYEELLRDIEEARASKLQTQLALSQYYASQNPDQSDVKQEFEKAAGVESDLPKRTLTRP